MSDSESDGGDEKVPSLREVTYGGWRSRLEALLDRKRVGVYVDGTKPCPTAKPAGPGADATAIAAAEKAEEKIAEWRLKDRQAKGIIAGYLPSDHLHMVKAARTAKELWDSIVLKYEGNRSGASVAATMVDMVNKRWEEGTSLEKHISWYRDNNELLAKFDPGTGSSLSTSFTGAAYPEHVLTVLLINSIPSVGEWGAVKAVIFAGGVFKFETVAAKLMGEQSRLRLDEKERGTGGTAAANYSSSAKTSKKPKDEWQTQEKKGAARPTCSHCSKSGHSADDCWTLHPDLMPERYKKRQKASKRASRAQHHSSDESGEDDHGWAGFGLLEVEETDEDHAAAVAAAPVVDLPQQVSLTAKANEEQRVSVRSNGIKHASLETNWFMDSGASLHYCREKEMFETIVPTTGRHVLLGDGRRIPVLGHGTLKVNAPTFDGLSAGVLKDVQYAPDMAVNLLSVSSLTDADLEVRFKQNDCTVRDGERVVARARKVANKLYQLTLGKRLALAAPDAGSGQAPSPHSSTRLAQLWHRRMCHTHWAALRRLFGDGMVRDEQGVDQARIARAFRDSACVSGCEACALAKATRKKFLSGEATRASRQLELVHMDLCTMPRSAEGFKYFLSIQDDSSRRLWTYFLASKREALPAYRQWVTAAEAEHSAAGYKVVAVRSDNGGEFISRAFDALLAERGSRRERTVPHTPQQNGVSERINRTLLNSVRAMLHDGQLDDRFWPEALRTAVYVHNRVPTRAVAGRTPYEAWCGRKPGVSHLRAFGCLAFAHVPATGRGKLDLRARKCVFLGYEPDRKAYRLWDIDARKIIVSRDVDFWEDRVWTCETGGRGGEDAAATKLARPSSKSRQLPHRAAAHRDTSREPESDDDESGSDSDPELDSEPADSEQEPAAAGGAEPVPQSVAQPAPQSAAESAPQPVAAPKRKGRLPKTDPHFVSSELRALRDRLEPGSKDVAPSCVDVEFRALPTCDSVEREPRSFKEAQRGPRAREWRAACESEVNKLLQAGTYELVPRPKGKVNIVQNKFVFKCKYNADGVLLERKARLVAKGFSQKPGVDYEETYAPVVRYAALRALFAHAAQHDWEVHHMDVRSAFLNGNLEETIYMSQPEGFEVEGKEDMVCLLKKSLYGLKQAGRQWNLKADRFMRKLGFTPLDADYCVYIYRKDKALVIVALYVDDLFLFTRRGDPLLEKLKRRLQQKFEMTDLGEVKEALGVEIKRDRTARSLTITQRRHTQGILERAGMADCRPVTTPMASGVQLCLPPKDHKATAADTLRYQRAIGELNYLVAWTRPDIAFTVSALSKYNSNPGLQHFAALQHLYRYLRGTHDHGITYRGSGDKSTPLTLTIYSDSDYAACIDDRRSVTGYSVHLCGATVSWQSTRQKTTAQSTVEAEYMASAEAVKEAIWWRAFMRGLGHRRTLRSATVLYSDNQGSIALSKNPDSHRRTKHIDVKYHLLREHVQKRTVALQFIGSSEMAADVLTKGLTPVKHQKAVGLLGIGA